MNPRAGQQWKELEHSLIPADTLPESLETQLVCPPAVGLWLFWGMGAFIVAAALWTLFAELEVTVRCRGYIRSLLPTQTLRSPAEGIVEAVLVHLHQQVRRGDTLLQLRNTDIRLRLQGTEEELRHEERLLTELSQLLRHLPTSGTPSQLLAQFPPLSFSTPQVRNLAETIRKDLQLFARHYESLRKGWERTGALHEKQFASAEEYEAVTTELRLQELRTLQYLQSRRQELAQRIEAGENRLRELRQLVGLLHEQLHKTALIAPISGQISQLYISQAGVYVAAGQEVLTITPDMQLEVELFVAPEDIVMVRPGQRVRYLIAGFPPGQWEALWGRVESVAEDLTTNGHTLAYRVRASLEGDTLRTHRLARHSTAGLALRKGLPIEAAIYIGRKPLIAWLSDRSRLVWDQLSP